MNVISIQSQVAFGHVGNSAAVFPMQMHGIDVVAVPTTLLSNRPGYPTIRGRVLDAELVADLLRGIEERGAVDTAQMILSGYLGSADNATVVADFVARAKAKNPALLYCCDPVLGRSRPRPVRPRRHPAAGARPAVPARRYRHAQSFRVRMAERGEDRDDRSGAQGGARVHGARARSSSPAPSWPTRPAARSRALAVERANAWRVRTPKLPISPNGTGDLFAALLVAARVRGADTPEALSHAASAIFAVLERTAASATTEMRIVESAEQLVHPKRKFECIAISRVGWVERRRNPSCHPRQVDGFRCAQPILRDRRKK